MLIVSQSRKEVVNIDVFGNVWISPYNIIWASENVSESKGELGNYENEDRAKQVLRDLWSAYANGEKVFFMPEK